MSESKRKQHKHEAAQDRDAEELKKDVSQIRGEKEGPQEDIMEKPGIEGAEQETKEGEKVSLSAEELNALKQELEKAQNQSKEYFEGWQRERADFMNYKKRIERDQAQLNQVITANIVKKYLAVADDMDRALKNKPDQASEAKWADGIELIYRKLTTILEAEGIQRIPAEKEMFDPNLHEAITHEDSPDHESGQVIEVLQQGYVIGDRVIRPALVRVAR